jgi:hypothetical protein
MSDDIDLFTDADYDSIDFNEIDQLLRRSFSYVSTPSDGIIGMGRSYLVGESKEETVKLDLYYTDNFIRPALVVGEYRLATVDDIVAMKIDIVQRKGRKRDFWDLHELLEGSYSVETMIALHRERSPYGHDESTIRTNLTDFSNADEDFDPKCLRGKIWELIKYDLFKKLNPE